MKVLYHKIMLKMNSFLFGRLSTKAHKHLGYLTAYGLKEGFEQTEREKLFDQLLMKKQRLNTAKLMREHRFEYGYKHPMSDDTYISMVEDDITEIEKRLKKTRTLGS